jgi:hypothetical protein
MGSLLLMGIFGFYNTAREGHRVAIGDVLARNSANARHVTFAHDSQGGIATELYPLRR